MARTARMGAALATAIAACAVAAGPSAGALAPLHNRSKLEHVIHQKQKELARLQAKAQAGHERWLRVLAHRDQQKEKLLERWQAKATSCEAAAHCSDVRKSHVDEEQERLSGEIQADQKLAATPEPGEAPHPKKVWERVHALEEQIQQREAELAALPSGARPHKH